MAMNAFSFSKPSFLLKSKQNLFSSPYPPTIQIQPRRNPLRYGFLQSPKTMVGLLGAGLTLTLMGPASASELPFLGSFQLSEPSNALSLPTWAVHVSSVVEWITAMALVWQYGEISGNESWKGLSWGMVPLLGGAFCACTWHFFYNSESLEVLVALQAALTVLGNATMCFAAFRIYKSSEERSKNL
ncbi:YCF49-like protein [Trema orientale]|uniref:YCF49-like protein n=1 Tax=Trema orientale TaxID=63057 RepID=A0A2P5F510_TREOI|nr:YCF49-like protein [Trema orientale]